MTLTLAGLLSMLNRLGLPTIPPEYENAEAYDDLDGITSGKYTPIASATQAGVTVTPASFRWLRVGDEVHAMGRIGITTTTNAFTSCKLTLPFDADFDEEGNGVACITDADNLATAATALALYLDSAALIAVSAGGSDIDLGQTDVEYQVSFAFTAA